MLERFHRTLNAMLGKVVADNQRDWHERLPTVMAAYRVTVHESTGYTPNRLIFGKEIRLLVDLSFGLPPDATSEDRSVNEYVDRVADCMYEDFKTVRVRLGDSAKVRKRRYDVKVTKGSLSVGQREWYYYPRRYTNRSPKWQNLYTGPYRVVRIIDPHVIVIRRSNRWKPFTVHRDKLKVVVEDPEFAAANGKNGEIGWDTSRVEVNGGLDAGMGDGERGADARPMRARRRPKHYDSYVCSRIMLSPCRDSTMPPRKRHEAKDTPRRASDLPATSARRSIETGAISSAIS